MSFVLRSSVLLHFVIEFVTELLGVGSWQLAVGSWQLAVGSWQLAVLRLSEESKSLDKITVFC